MTESLDRRELILNKAAEMFARKGIGATTVREIADAAGVLSGSLYHYFESKDAIVDEILRGYLDAIRARYEVVLSSGKDAAGCLHDLVLTSLQAGQERLYATAIYQNELQFLREQPRFHEIQQAAADIQRTWLEVIEKGVANGSFRGDIEPRVFYRLLRDAVWLSIRWNRPDNASGVDGLAEDVIELFLHGFAAQEPSPGKRVRPTADTSNSRKSAKR